MAICQIVMNDFIYWQMASEKSKDLRVGHFWLRCIRWLLLCACRVCDWQRLGAGRLGWVRPGTRLANPFDQFV